MHPVLAGAADIAGGVVGLAVILGVPVTGLLIADGMRFNGFNRHGKVIKNTCSSHSTGPSYTPEYNGPLQSNGTHAFSGVSRSEGGSSTTCIVTVAVEGEDGRWEEVELSSYRASQYPVGSTYHFTWLYRKGG